MRSRAHTPIGIDFDYNEFRAIQFDRDLNPAAVATIPRQGRRVLLPATEELDILAQLLAQRGFTGTQVALAVPKEPSSFHLLSLPPQGSGAPISQLALIEAQRSGAHKTKDLQIGFWTLPSKDGVVPKHSPYYTVAAETKPLDELVDNFEAVGFMPISIEPMETALARSASFHDEFIPDSIHAIVDFGWDNSNVVITLGRTPVYTRKIDFGASRFRRQLIDDHAMPVHGIKALLNHNHTNAVLPNNETIRDRRVNRIISVIMTPMLTVIAEQLDTALTYVSQQHRFAPFGVVFRSGYFSSMDSVAHAIAQRTGMPTLKLPTPAISSNPIDTPIESKITQFEALLSPRLSIAAGLALGAAQQNSHRSLQGAAS